MAGYNEDRCSQCKQITDPLRLLVKRAVFLKKGRAGVVRSRTLVYLCDTCVQQDPDWNADPRNSPGNTSAAKERIEQRRNGGNQV